MSFKLLEEVAKKKQEIIIENKKLLGQKLIVLISFNCYNCELLGCMFTRDYDCATISCNKSCSGFHGKVLSFSEVAFFLIQVIIIRALSSSSLAV